MDFYHLFGYLSGLLLARPGMEPDSLYLTAALVHFLDAGLCFLIASHSGRRSLPWALAGLVCGIWALGTLFLLPVKKPEKNP